MESLNTCFGLFQYDEDADTEALLPQYDDDTALQSQVQRRMHSYLMLRAIGQGYMPSTEQLIINLRTLVASDMLNPKNAGLSNSGRLVTKHTKQLLTDLIELLRHKNDRDQLQDFIWQLSKSRIEVDTEHLQEVAASSRAKADTSAGKPALPSVRDAAAFRPRF